MDVKERREKVEELLNKKREAVDIAKTLGVPVRTIKRDIEFIKAHSKRRQEIISASVQTEIMLGRKKEEKPHEVKVKRSKQIAKRREEVERLYNEEKTAKEIAGELGISIQIVYQDIRILIEEKRIVKRERKSTERSKSTRSEQIAKRREEVERLYNEGKTGRKIAEELGVSLVTVYSDLKVLEKDGKIRRKRTTRRKKTDKPKINIYKKIEELFSQGESYGEIADEVNMDILDVITYLQKLEEKGETKKTNTNRRTTVRRLYEEGRTIESIVAELHISETLVKEDLLSFGIIPDLGIVPEEEKTEQGEDESELQQTEGEPAEEEKKTKSNPKGENSKSISIKERRKIVEQLYDNGMDEEDIANELGVSVRVVERDIDAILDARRFKDENIPMETENDSTSKLTEEEQENIRKRRNKVEQLYKEGKTVSEIAEELRVEKSIIIADIKILMRDKRIPETNMKEFSEDRIERLKGQRKKEEREPNNVSINVSRRKKTYETDITKRREQEEALYNDGYAIEEIARVLGIPKATVYSDIEVLAEQGRVKKRTSGETLKLRKIRKKQATEEITEKILNLYNNGKTALEISEILEISISEVLNIIRNLKKVGKIVEKTEKAEENPRNKAEEMYYKSMLRSIKLFIKSGEFASVVRYVKTLNAEVKLSDKEKRDLNELLRLIVFRLRKEGNNIEAITDILKLDVATVERYLNISTKTQVKTENVEAEFDR